MATTNTKVEYDIVGNINDIVNKLGRVEDALGNLDKKNKQAEKSAQNFGGAINSFIGNLGANAISSLTSSLANLGSQIGGLARDAVINAVKQGDEQEKVLLKYKTLLGSQEAAAKRVQEILDFAAKTPFETAEISKADIILQGFGIRTEKRLKTIGDASAITGSSIDDLSIIMGQLSQSKDLENIKQLVERGVVSFDELKRAGIRFAKDGSVINSVQETFTAVENIMAKKFGGGMDALSNTISGKMSTAMDTVNLKLGELAQNTGLNDLIKKIIDVSIPIMDTILTKVGILLNSFKEDNALTRILQFAWQSLKDLGEQSAPLLSNLLNKIFEESKVFFTENEGKIKYIIDFVKELAELSLPILVKALETVWDIVKNIVQAFIDATVAFRDFEQKIQGIEKLTDVRESVGNFMSNIGKNAMGTSNFGGGFTMVGENGPELLNLPKNSAIKPASASQNISNNTNNQTVINNFRFSKLSDLKNQLALI